MCRVMTTNSPITCATLPIDQVLKTVEDGEGVLEIYQKIKQTFDSETMATSPATPQKTSRLHRVFCLAWMACSPARTALASCSRSAGVLPTSSGLCTTNRSGSRWISSCRLSASRLSPLAASKSSSAGNLYPKVPRTSPDRWHCDTKALR